MKNAALSACLVPLNENDLTEVKGGFGLLMLPVIGFVSGYLYQEFVTQISQN